MARELGAKAKEEAYLAFLGYLEEVRRHIYSTNVVESIKARIEQIRLELGGYLPSQDALKVNLQDRWLRRAVPTVRSKGYELRQLFALRYELDEEAVDMLHNF